MPRPRSYQDVILADNPYAYLRLGDNGTTTFKDEVGGHFGQNTSSASDLTGGKPGALPNDPNRSVNFAGGNTNPPTVITLSNTTNWDPTILTCECWVYPTAASTGQLWNKELTQNLNWRVRIDSGLTVTILVQGGSHDQTSTATVTLNAWNHVVVSMSGTAGAGGTCQIFINGKLDVTGTTGIGPGAAAPLAIGQSSSEELTGRIQECAFYTYALKPGQVAEHYQARVNPVALPVYSVFLTGASAFTSTTPVQGWGQVG